MVELLLFATCLGMASAVPIDYYATRYDHIDVETILNNRRMVNYYAACLMSQGPCPPQGVELKRILPEALQTNCVRCTEKQKTVAFRSIKRLKKEYPKIWNELAALWDPDGSYIDKFEQSFRVNHPQLPDIVKVSNRFGDDGDESETTNTVIKNNNEPASSSTTVSYLDSTSSAITTSTTTTTTTTTSPPLTTTTTTTTKRPPTKPPKTNNKPPETPPPIATVGADLQATVSFATNIMGGIAKGLGELGDKVVVTGARLAEAVLSSILPK